MFFTASILLALLFIQQGVILKIIQLIKVIWVASFAVMLLACSTAPTELSIEPDAWVYEKRAIQITVKAPADLNSVSGRPHSLALGVFQLSDPNTFSGLAETKQGAVELLQKGRIDDTVVNFTLINVQPGEEKKLSLNRAQTAQYLAVIAGYYDLNPKKDVKVFAIPLRALKRGLIEKSLVTLSLMADEAKAVPDKIKVYAELGRDSSKQIILDTDQRLLLEQKDGQSTQSIDWFNKVQQ